MILVWSLLTALFFLVSSPIFTLTAVGSLATFDSTCVGFPVVNWEYITTPVIPIPCCPLLCRIAWNLEPNKSCPNTFSILFCGIPGPLSSVCNSKISFLESILEIFTIISGKILASSQASNELSTASFTAVIIDL